MGRGRSKPRTAKRKRRHEMKKTRRPSDRKTQELQPIDHARLTAVQGGASMVEYALIAATVPGK
jgi:hypothetical protein